MSFFNKTSTDNCFRALLEVLGASSTAVLSPFSLLISLHNMPQMILHLKTTILEPLDNSKAWLPTLNLSYLQEYNILENMLYLLELAPLFLFIHSAQLRPMLSLSAIDICFLVTFSIKHPMTPNWHTHWFSSTYPS